VSPDGTINRPTEASLRLIYDTIAEELEKQFEQIDSLNSRAHQLLGFAAITVGVVLSLRPPSRDALVSGLFALALVGFACIAGAGVRAWALQGWRHDPEPRPLWDRHRLRSEEWLRHQIILNRLDAVDENANAIDAKLYWVRWTQRLLALEVIYLVALVIVVPYLS
jgi:hypothetical protein